MVASAHLLAHQVQNKFFVRTLKIDFFLNLNLATTTTAATTTTTTTTRATTPAPLCSNGAPDSAFPYCCTNGARNQYCCLNGANNPDCTPPVQNT